MDSVINLIKYCPKTKITTYHSKKKENIGNKFIKTINTINNLKKIKDEKAINLKNKTENLVTKQTSLKEKETHSEDKTSKNTNIRKTWDDKTIIDLSSKILMDPINKQEPNKSEMLSNINKKDLNEFVKNISVHNSDILQTKTNHQIITQGLPVHSKARLLPNEKLIEAKKIFNELIEKEIIRPSSSNWSSALLMKKKKDNSWRCCGDYRKLNSITIKDEYPVPLIRDVTTRLAEAKFFTKLDLEKHIIRYVWPMKTLKKLRL